MSYSPHKHTIAYSVMELFKSKPAATRIGAGAIADAIDQPRESVLWCIKPLLENKLLNKIIENGITYFELGEAAYKPVKVRLGRNDLPAELMKEMRSESHLPPSLRALDDDIEDDLNSYKPLPDPPEPKPEKHKGTSVPGLVEIKELPQNQELNEKLEKAVAAAYEAGKDRKETEKPPPKLEYAYHSNGFVVITKDKQTVSLTPDECAVIAKFIEAVENFEKVKL